MQPWYINPNRNRRDPDDRFNDNIARHMNHFESTGQWTGDAIIVDAAILGRDDIIRFALDHGCPMNGSSMAVAYGALRKHLHCVQLLHERGYRMNEDCSSFAARGGDLPCLEYVINHGGPLTADTFENASDHPMPHIYDYLIEKNCPFNLYVVSQLIKFKLFTQLKKMFQKTPSFDITIYLSAFNENINEIDFSDAYWKDLLFLQDLTAYPKIQEKQFTYTREKSAYRVITSLVLEQQVNKDVLRYIIGNYI